jgi:MFS family permease
VTETVLTPTKPLHPLRVRDFRLLWAGESISLLGDQFYLIALPWLVLQITDNPLALGTVVAVASIPRALFMLVGGALVDRFSPRTIMFVSNLARMVLVGVLAALVLTGAIQLWMLYLLALAFGTADAFFFPAQSAMVPAILHSDQLEAGNALTQGTAMLSVFLGPVIAGIVIAAVAGTNLKESLSLQGIGVAFALDAFSFLASLLCLRLIRTHKESMKSEDSVLSSIKEGLAFVWNSTVLRIIFILVICMNFLVNGPFEIGIPVLANDYLAEGAAAFGTIVSAFGGGALLGVILASILPKPTPARFGTTLMSVATLLGIGMLLLPLSNSTPVVALISLGMGAVNGFVNIHFMTWFQRRIPEHLMGRVMSLIIFATVGVVPVSSSLAGFILNINLPILFISAGVLMTAITLLFMTMRPIRRMGLETAESMAQTEPAEVVLTPDIAA